MQKEHTQLHVVCESVKLGSHKLPRPTFLQEPPTPNTTCVGGDSLVQDLSPPCGGTASQCHRFRASSARPRVTLVLTNTCLHTRTDGLQHEACTLEPQSPRGQLAQTHTADQASTPI